MPTQAEIEQQQLQEYFSRQRRAEADNKGKLIMDFGGGPEDVTPYLSMRHPGTVPLKGMSDPYVMLKNGEEKRKAWRGPEGGQYLWATVGKSADGRDHTRAVRQAVHQGDLRPVEISEIDKDSPYAIYDDMNIDTREGPKKTVTCDGQCLYEVSLKKSIEWYGLPLQRYKGDLAEMQFSGSKRLQAEGYGKVPHGDLSKFLGVQVEEGSNMAVSPATTEEVFSGPTSNMAGD